jgi:hypothetical protein
MFRYPMETVIKGAKPMAYQKDISVFLSGLCDNIEIRAFENFRLDISVLSALVCGFTQAKAALESSGQGNLV